ncbi:MAG: hypothetical protein ACHQIO_06120 [Nevskiales bacterium]
MSASRCPCGVIAYDGEIVCYELPKQGDANGGRVVEARRLGQKVLLEITPELRAAIEADLRKGREAK